MFSPIEPLSPAGFAANGYWSDGFVGLERYEARKIIGIHKRLKPAVTRPDAWWFALADWYIPLAERLPRDRIPLRR